MKLIINISDKTYEIIKNMVYFYNSQRSGNEITKEILTAIKQGIPLPKGHGDLIDRDELLADSYPIDDWGGNEINIVDVMTVKMADAIIKADKEGSEK